VAKSDIQAGRAYVSLYAKGTELTKALNKAKKELHAFGTEIVKIGGAVAGMGTAITAGLSAATAQFATAGAAMASGIDTLTSVLAPAGLLWGTSLLLSNPRYAQWAVQYANARTKGYNSGQIAAHVNRLREMALLDPQLAPIARAFANEHGVEEAGNDDRGQNQKANPKPGQGGDQIKPQAADPVERIDKAEQRRLASDKRKAAFPLKQKAEEAEKRLAKATADLARLDLDLAKSGQSAEQIKALMVKRAALIGVIEQAESDWLEASEAYEAAVS
jgi:hypothetical protein